MKPTKVEFGWCKLPGWTITWERKGGYCNCPAPGWYVHPAFGSEKDCDSLGPFRTLKEAVEAVEKR